MPGNTIADSGCGGTGRFSIGAAKLTKDIGHVYAIDILSKALSALEGKMRIFNLHNITPIKADLENERAINIQDESIDIGVLSNVLDESKKPDMILKITLRLLKRGGKLLLINRTPIWSRLWHGQSSHLQEEKCRLLCSKFPLQKIEDLRLGSHYYGFISKKI